MLPDRVSNPGHLTYESGALPIALHGLASAITVFHTKLFVIYIVWYEFSLLSNVVYKSTCS